MGRFGGVLTNIQRLSCILIGYIFCGMVEMYIVGRVLKVLENPHMSLVKTQLSFDR